MGLRPSEWRRAPTGVPLIDSDYRVRQDELYPTVTLIPGTSTGATPRTGRHDARTPVMLLVADLHVVQVGEIVGEHGRLRKSQ
jgi:hypothetical protein